MIYPRYARRIYDPETKTYCIVVKKRGGIWRKKPSNEPQIRNAWLFEQFRAFEELNIHLKENKTE